MHVGQYDSWVRHLDRADKQPFRVWIIRGKQTDDAQLWVAESQTQHGRLYYVHYTANRHGEFVACNCRGAQFGLQCKHSASVLAAIHPSEFRDLIRSAP